MTPYLSSEPDGLDELFDCLGHARRRRLVSAVEAEPTPIPVERVADRIADTESNAIDGSAADDMAEQIAVTLVHAHLPKLRAAEIVDVDDGTSMVWEGRRFERALTFLEAI